MATRVTKKVFDDALSETKCKAQFEVNEAIATSGEASKLVADKGSMIKHSYTPEDSKMTPTCNTDKPQSF